MYKPLPHKYKSYDEAKAALEKHGKLEYFGREGRNAETYVCKFHRNDGRVYFMLIDEDGSMRIKE
ncbi:hypothetical protein DVH26_07825 [Paenibacillus sp. H1-7]|nr:hypothetical protein DVH26_07825 [Paenibacillus sp. H1-7]